MYVERLRMVTTSLGALSNLHCHCHCHCHIDLKFNVFITSNAPSMTAWAVPRHYFMTLWLIHVFGLRRYNTRPDQAPQLLSACFAHRRLYGRTTSSSSG